MLNGLAESAALRMTLVLVVVLGVQTSTLSELRVGHTVIDLVALLAVGAGIVAGPQRGGRIAFFIGFGFDLLLPTPFGVKSLVYGLTGFLAGLLPADPIENVRVVRIGAMAGMCAGLAFAEGPIAAMFGEAQAVSFALLTATAVGAVVGATLGPITLRVARWALMAGDQARI